MITLIQKYTKGRQRTVFESKAELQETDFRRKIRIVFKAHEKRENVDNDALGQKERMPFFLNIFRKNAYALFGQSSNPERKISTTKKSHFP